MSRIGKKPIVILEKVKVEVKDMIVSVEGPKGKLTYKIPAAITVSISDGKVNVARCNDTKVAKSLHGLTRALIANMIKGVSSGYSKELDIVGVGYRAQLEGKALVMQLGFTHPVKYTPPEDVKLEVVKQTHIAVSGIDKAKVGQVAAEIRRLRPPEPYKGTGIKYTDEQIKRKLGKSAATGAKK
jgi:large subunit ribosomal protein L6